MQQLVPLRVTYRYYVETVSNYLWGGEGGVNRESSHGFNFFSLRRNILLLKFRSNIRGEIKSKILSKQRKQPGNVSRYSHAFSLFLSLTHTRTLSLSLSLSLMQKLLSKELIMCCVLVYIYIYR